jgi:diadenosine tetraphosphate (Ap4A) HIT family hydrolase
MNEDCRYCNRTTDIVDVVADMKVSTLYITKDQTYHGRCILALKEHKTEVCQLKAAETAAFGRDMAKASRAIYEAFKPDKINYAAFGDTYPHLHFHLVPKYKGGKSWGVPFDLSLKKEAELPVSELAVLINLLRSKL